MSKKPRTLVQFLAGQDQGLTRLFAQAKLLTQIKTIINQVVDYQIAQQLEVAKIQNKTLTVLCESPVWATRLRYMEPQIIEKLQQYSDTRQVQKLQIKVRPNSTSEIPDTSPKRRATMSQDAADQIREYSEAISDPKLQEALKKLAGRAKK